MATPKRLPNKPSKLIRVALADLARVERSIRYVVNMGFAWHSPGPAKDDTWCSVCWAGSVMAKSLGVRVSQRAFPEDFHYRTKVKLWALDEFRCGNIGAALRFLDIKKPRKLPANLPVPSYDYGDPKAWRESMLVIADRLERAGL